MYTRENVRPPSFAPPWLIEQLKAAKAKTDAAGKRIVEEDDTARELLERWMLKHTPMAYDGEIDNTPYKVSAVGYDFGCSEATVLDIVSEWDQTHCFPQNNPTDFSSRSNPPTATERMRLAADTRRPGASRRTKSTRVDARRRAKRVSPVLARP
jgi:hypothetical protein